MKLSNPKSRGNWGIHWQDNHYESIFGHSGVKVSTGEIGKLPKDECIRHDFSYTKKLDKNYREMNSFKNPKDQAKISNEIFGRQQEYRTQVVRKELKQKYGY